VNKTITPPIGRPEDGAVPTATELLAALTLDQYHKLVGFARYRLRAVIRSRHLRHCLATLEPEDLVAEAVLKLELGDHDPTLGRHLPPEYRTDPARFLACLKGIIESDLNHLATAARTRYPELPVGDPEEQPDYVDPPSPEDPHATLSRRDLHVVLFQKLYQRIEHQPALLTVVRDWEARFYDDARIGSGEADHNRVERVRRLARAVLQELSVEPDRRQEGRELLL
jgi:hypothetical protein